MNLIDYAMHFRVLVAFLCVQSLFCSCCVKTQTSFGDKGVPVEAACLAHSSACVADRLFTVSAFEDLLLLVVAIVTARCSHSDSIHCILMIQTKRHVCVTTQDALCSCFSLLKESF